MGTTYYFTVCSYVTNIGNGTAYNVSAKTSGDMIFNYGYNPYNIIAPDTVAHSVGESLHTSDYDHRYLQTQYGYVQPFISSNTIPISSISGYTYFKMELNPRGTGFSGIFRIIFQFGSTQLKLYPPYVGSSTSIVTNSITLTSTHKTNWSSYYSSYGAPRLYIQLYSSFTDGTEYGEGYRFTYDESDIYKIWFE